MKASNYHSLHSSPIIDLMSMYCEDQPLEHEKIASVEWKSGNDELIFYQHLENETGLPFSDEEMESFFDGDIKIAKLIETCTTLEKHAKRLSPEEKAKRRQYYQRNKERLARKAKIRRRRQKSGTKIKKKRRGTADTGYTFTPESPGARSGGGGGASVPSGAAAKRQQFHAQRSGKSRRPKGLQK